MILFLVVCVLLLQQPRSKHEHRSCTRSHHNYCLAALRLNSLTSTTNVFQPFCIIFRVILVCALRDIICMIHHDTATVCICYTVCVALKHSTGKFVMNIYHTIFVISLVFVCVNNFLVCLFPFQSYQLVSFSSKIMWETFLHFRHDIKITSKQKM